MKMETTLSAIRLAYFYVFNTEIPGDRSYKEAVAAMYREEMEIALAVASAHEAALVDIQLSHGFNAAHARLDQLVTQEIVKCCVNRNSAASTSTGS